MRSVWTIIAVALMLPTAAVADFSVSKPAPKPKPAKSQPAPAPRPAPGPREVHRAPVRPRPTPTPAPPPVLTGIDPVFVNQTIEAAGYRTNFTGTASTSGPSISTSSGNSAWIVAFKDCDATQRCGQMEFYTLWRVGNEANVCSSWKVAITNDPDGFFGKPTCYTLPNARNELHLSLSSNQSPYTGLNLLSGERARSRIQTMLTTWTSYVVRLPEAYEYARTHCPRKGDKCESGKSANATPPRPRSVSPPGI